MDKELAKRLDRIAAAQERTNALLEQLVKQAGAPVQAKALKNADERKPFGRLYAGLGG